MEYGTKGIHIISDFWGVDAELLDDLLFMETIARLAVNKSGANLISTQSHKFEPSGCTVLLLLSESHLSLHTYPNHNYASLDVYTCGTADPKEAIDYLKKWLEPTETFEKEIIRGVK